MLDTSIFNLEGEGGRGARKILGGSHTWLVMGSGGNQSSLAE